MHLTVRLSGDLLEVNCFMFYSKCRRCVQMEVLSVSQWRGVAALASSTYFLWKIQGLRLKMMICKLSPLF